MMNSLITFIVEMNISLFVFYAVYLVFFRKDGNFSSRRMWLLAAMILSLVLPLLKVQVTGPVQEMRLSVFSIEEVVLRGTAVHHDASTTLSPGAWVLLIYVMGTGILFSRMVVMIGRILFQRHHSERIRMNGVWVRKNSTLHASSFFRTVFMDPGQLEGESRNQVLAHEMCHVGHWHSIDRLLMEIILAICWINPFAWLMRRSMIENHEYQADNNVIIKGTDQVSYQVTLLNQYIGSASIPLYNQFSSQIKNRINMLNTKNKSRSAWKSLLILPITMMLFALISCGNEEQVKTAPDEATAPYEEELFFVVEEMPQWNDGTDMITNTRNFIAQNLTYPKEAIENNVEGKIFIQFIVNSKGEVIIPDPAMLPPELNKGKENEVVVVGYRTINEEDAMPDEKYIQLLKDEAVRVMNEVPDMIPGKQRGKAVSVVFTMPIVFKLQ